MKKYLSSTECAEQLGLSRSTVHKLLDEGLIRGLVYRYGERATIRIEQAEVERFQRTWADDGDGSAARARDA